MIFKYLNSSRLLFIIVIILIVTLIIVWFLDNKAPAIIYNSERYIAVKNYNVISLNEGIDNDEKIQKKKLSKLEFYILFREFRKKRKSSIKNYDGKPLYYLNSDFLVDCNYLKSYFKSILFTYYEGREMRQSPGAVKGEESLQENDKFIPTITIPIYDNKVFFINEDFQFCLNEELEVDNLLVNQLKYVFTEFEGIIDKKFKLIRKRDMQFKGKNPKVEIKYSKDGSANYAKVVIPNGRNNVGSIILYESFFKIKDKNKQIGILRHEVGHVLGFAHESKVLYEDKKVLDCVNSQKDDKNRNLLNICPDTSSFMMTECILKTSDTIVPRNLYCFSFLDSMILDSIFNNPKYKTNEAEIFKNFNCN